MCRLRARRCSNGAVSVGRRSEPLETQRVAACDELSRFDFESQQECCGLGCYGVRYVEGIQAVDTLWLCIGRAGACFLSGRVCRREFRPCGRLQQSRKTLCTDIFWHYCRFEIQFSLQSVCLCVIGSNAVLSQASSQRRPIQTWPVWCSQYVLGHNAENSGWC